MSTRRARTALCTLAVAVTALVSTLGTAAAAGAEQARTAGAPLVLLSQTPWVSAAQPWFNLDLGVSRSEGAASGLQVNLTFYGRFDDGSDLQQALSGAPSGTPLSRAQVPVTDAAGVLTAAACVTVLPESSASAPSSGPGICAAGVPGGTLTLGCTLSSDECQGVYAVSVALVRSGSSSPLSRFTTFLTYQQPKAMSSSGGALRVGVVVPVTTSGVTSMADALTEHRDVATTLAVSPLAVSALEASRAHDGEHAFDQLAALTGDQMIDQPYVPINVVALSGAGIGNEIGAQMDRGDQVLRGAGLKPVGGPWVDTASTFAQGDASSLASGLQLAGASQAVISDADLSSGGTSNQTFAQPFTLDLGHGSTVAAVAANSDLSTRFTADQANPVLGAEQLVAELSFVHFENPFFSAPRGVVVAPPPGWRPSAAFMDALLEGLSGNEILNPVTLAQLFTQVPAGGNREPAVRQLQTGTADHGITRGAAERIALDRQQLSSFSLAVGGHPDDLTVLGDTLLTTEARGLSAVTRSAALTAYAKTFAGTTGQVTLATERTVTFTSQRADIPVTVLSSAPYPVTVVVTLSSDKFTFPNGNSHQLLLNRPTTSWRFAAQARTSGDHLPIVVTLHTPDGQVVIAHTVLTVHSTEISFVGVALTVLAAAVLLVWWVRTWRRAPRPPAGALTVASPRRARTLALRTSAVYVAAGTGASRVTGLLRFVALAWALGQTPLADSYNLANTTPNMLYDIVLGGILSATFIPVFVDRLSNKTEREAFDSISAVLTVSVAVLGVTTLAALVAAPFLIDALTVLDTHSGPDQIHRVLLERQVATEFLRWFVIQIAAYGLFALGAALLNTRRRFVAVAWAPIVNNLVCIGVLVWFGLWAGHGASLASVEQHKAQLVLLGLGTSLGVVLQGVALVPSLRNADLGLLRWRWNPRDDALRAVTRLGGWTFGFVLANQIALFVVTVLAGSVAGPDPVSSYTYAYAFFQLPYGIVAVTVMSVVTPDLAERWSTGQRAAFLHRMTGGLRAVLALIIPSAVGMLLLARPAVALLLGVGHSTPAETATTGAALAMFALGLPGFCAYLYFVRVLQSMQRTRVAFYLYLVENALNIVLALLLVRPLGVRGLALSLSIAYTVAALLAFAVFHQWFGRLAARETWAPLVRVLIASVPMGIVVLVVSNLSASTTVVGLLVRVVGSVVAGGLTFGAVVVWLGRRHDSHRRPPSRPAGPVGPTRPLAPVQPVGPVGPPGATRRVASSREAEELDPPPPESTDALPRLA